MNQVLKTEETEEVVHDVVTQAERACQAAVEATPPAYRGFLTFLSRTKKASGPTAHPVSMPIREPYMGVDGRVKMAIDDHRAAEASLVIQTAFEVEPHSGQLLCRAVVTSAFLGSATAHARVFLGGDGVDATNPLENAETSAVGRALGFLGYGLYGTGIASAEEVLRARAARDTNHAEAEAEAVPSTVESRPPSPRQRQFLRALLERTGIPKEEVETQLAAMTTSREASMRINQLREQVA
jgi:hypothetical protein